MALGGCLSCIKYLMFVFNFIFWLVGCIILSLGIWVLVDPKTVDISGSTDVDLGHYYNLIGYIFVVVGSIIMVVGFAGCCGAIRESQCLLATFFVFLFIIFSILVAIGVFVIMNKSKVTDPLKENVAASVTADLKRYVNNYGNDSKSKEKMDDYQRQFNCCGYDKGLSDYKAADQTPALRTTCSTSTKACTPDVIKLVQKQHDDAFKAFNDSSVIAAGVAIGMGVVMLLGMIFSMMLCCAIRDTNG